MADTPEIKVIIDKDWPKLTVYIKNNERNDDVEGIIAAVQSYIDNKSPSIMAYCGDEMNLIPQRRIIRLYVSNRKVYVETVQKTYEVKKRLHEIESILDKRRFVRISQSEMINIHKVKNFDFSSVGTIGVELANGYTTWVARRRVKDVRNLLESSVNSASIKPE